MTSINFNDLKGDNITEIIKYLHPHTEENEMMKKELKIYKELFKNVKGLIEQEYEAKNWNTGWRRNNIKRRVAATASPGLLRLDPDAVSPCQMLTNIDRLLKECLEGRKAAAEYKLKIYKIGREVTLASQRRLLEYGKQEDINIKQIEAEIDLMALD